MEEIIVDIGGCPVLFTVPKNRNASTPPEDDAELEAQSRAFMAELGEVESALTPEIWAQYRAAKAAKDQQDAADRALLAELEASENCEIASQSAKQWHHDEDVREFLKGYDHLKESLQREGGSPCDAEETELVLKKLASVEAQRRFLQFGDDESDTQDGFLRAWVSRDEGDAWINSAVWAR
nr:hypothetical protein B0A51_12088 [Rachicladosporium sp. CCFEE 5018]